MPAVLAGCNARIPSAGREAVRQLHRGESQPHHRRARTEHVRGRLRLDEVRSTERFVCIPIPIVASKTYSFLFMYVLVCFRGATVPERGSGWNDRSSLGSKFLQPSRVLLS